MFHFIWWWPGELPPLFLWEVFLAKPRALASPPTHCGKSLPQIRKAHLVYLKGTLLSKTDTMNTVIGVFPDKPSVCAQYLMATHLWNLAIAKREGEKTCWWSPWSSQTTLFKSYKLGSQDLLPSRIALRVSRSEIPAWGHR